jgi:hypothetical protein
MQTWLYRIALSLVFAGLFYWLYPNQDPNPRPELWGLQQESNQTSLLGLNMGKTTLHEAMQRLKIMPNIAMFTKQHIPGAPEPAKSLEAFFEGVFDEGDDIILGIDADDKLLAYIKKEAFKPEIMPNGVVRVGVRKKLYAQIQALPISSITVIAGKHIDMDAFQAKFGKPEQLLNDGQGNAHFLYPKLGLDLIQPSDGAHILQLVSPDMFDKKLKQPLLETQKPQ